MKITLIILGILLAIQLIRPEQTNPPVDEALTLKAPENVMKILKASCYDCHSYETHWPAYAQIAPLSWNIVGHVNDGRAALNFSNWKKIDPKVKVKRLKRSIKTVNNGMMPLPNYLLLHKAAQLSNKEKKTIIDWCNKELKNLHKSKEKSLSLSKLE